MNTKLLATAVATIFLAAGAAAAQAPAGSTDTTGAYADTTVAPVEEDDDGMDLGWLGLLGLAGLLGLKKRRDDTVRTHPASTTTMNR
ncbi:MAG TPA: WGxxGxxG family protein [Brevundimonas sp.]|nr:WGxxGxxG family protein [Brevundimonas sp.]